MKVLCRALRESSVESLNIAGNAFGLKSRTKIILACEKLLDIDGKEIGEHERLFARKMRVARGVIDVEKANSVESVVIEEPVMKVYPHLPPFISQYRYFYLFCVSLK